MSDENFVLGMDCKLYKGDALLDGDTSTPATVTWSEADNVKDLNLNLETDEADVTTRGNNGWKATAATLKSGSIEFEMLWKPSDAIFTALLNAWLNKAEVALAAMSGAITVEGKQGLASNFTVTNFSRNEPLGEAVTVSRDGQALQPHRVVRRAGGVTQEHLEPVAGKASTGP